MPRRLHNLFWLALTLLFAGQSLLPAVALAEVTVRCAGMAAASAPCARVTVAASDTAAVSPRAAGLACCRAMAHCPMTAAAARRPAPGAAAFVSAPPGCLVSVRLLAATPTALNPPAHRTLLLRAPAPALPASHSAPVLTTAPAVAASPALPFHLPPSVLTHAHGLRAPPAA